MFPLNSIFFGDHLQGFQLSHICTECRSQNQGHHNSSRQIIVTAEISLDLVKAHRCINQEVAAKELMPNHITHQNKLLANAFPLLL